MSEEGRRSYAKDELGQDLSFIKDKEELHYIKPEDSLSNKTILTQEETKALLKSNEDTSIMDALEAFNTLVNHPKYYNKGKIEVIDFIEDQGLGFHLGNVVKYICRETKAKNKEERLRDLEKALWYLERYINNLSGYKD